MALGFLNNDLRPQNIDLVTVSDDMNTFRAHTFNKQTMMFDNKKSTKVSDKDGNAMIQSIQIAKDQTILRSLFVTYWKDKPVKGHESSFMKVFRQIKMGEFDSKREYSPNLDDLELYMNVQPFWLDIDGDML